MQTFAVSGQFALAGGFAPSSRQIPLAVLPRQALLAALLDAPALIVVVRVVGAALLVHLTLQLAYRLDIGGQFGAEDLQAWGALKRHNGYRGGSQVQPNRSCPRDAQRDY